MKGKNRNKIKSERSISERSISPNIFEARIFKNKTNHQYNLPILKRHISPKVIEDIFDNKNVIGLKFKITDIITKENIGKEEIFKNKKVLKRGQIKQSLSRPPFKMKGGYR